MDDYIFDVVCSRILKAVVPRAERFANRFHCATSELVLYIPALYIQR